MLRIIVLLGGFLPGPDGYADSAGMIALAHQLKHIPHAQVRVMQWSSYPKAYADFRKHPKDRHVVIGYSGGGSRATWLANIKPHPRIDLAVLYDPSPRWQMQSIPCTVTRTISYTNLHPRFVGLGGGVAKGCHVERFNISMNHIRVQTNRKLHRTTIEAINDLAR